MEYPANLLQEVATKTIHFQLEGFLAGKGPLGAMAMLVGEAPGRTEIETGIPFSGQAGKELDAELAKAGLSRDDIYITSAVRSRPFHIKQRIDRNGFPVESRPNRTPTRLEVMAFAPLLDFEIHQIRPRIIAPMGNIALKRLLGNSFNISSYHGQMLEMPILKISNDRTRYEKTEERYTIFPLYHPAAILYNRSLKEDIAADWSGLVELMKDLNND